ncbi:SMC family ATPase [Actinoallomurus sp. NBC_01490]|uniref:SMC family ATPase n=1 Tax=Actinoallomurus sp. NBC_01490 TaxID=2903557 RepID=UPI002E2ECDAA|nr:SMC family ATPase [Actinoallomurus sp. NBC_01490]
MRPKQLTFAGLRSYPGQAQTLDFTGKSQVGILGDTGAGKTTILEAITLALYGTPTWAKEGAKELIAEGEPSMVVELTFEHDGQTWRIRRVYYARNRPHTHLLENLDTGETTDNRGAVNRRIERLLKLRREDFQSAVLPPQGKFDLLLNASETERSQILKGIFGTTSLTATRSLADQQRQTIRDLLDQAVAARATYLLNPAEEAKTATLAAQAAQRRTDHLEGALVRMSALQKKAAAHRIRSAALTSARSGLDTSLARLDINVLDAMVSVEEDLAEAERQLISDEASAGAQRTQAQQRLRALADEGATVESVTSAATVLSELPRRLSTLQAAQTRLEGEQEQIDHDGERLEAEQAHISDLHFKARQLTEQAESARSSADRTGKATTELVRATYAALSAAAAVARAREAESQAAAAHLEADQRLPGLREAVSQAEQKATEALHQVDAAVREDAAYAAGHGLHPGDACSVCTQALPTSYLPPPPADPARLTAAQKARMAADRAVKNAGKQLARSEATHEAADRELQAARKNLDEALRRLSDQATHAKNAAAQPLLSPTDAAVAIDHHAFGHDLDAALHALQQRGASPEHSELTRETDALCRPAQDLTEALSTAATAARDSAQTAEADVTSAARLLTSEQANLTRRQQTHTATCQELDSEIDTLQETLSHLPPMVATVLSGPILSIRSDHIDAAGRALAGLNERLQKATGNLKTADATLADVATARLDLQERRQISIQAPLTALLTEASALIAAAQTAQSVLDPTLPPLPSPPAAQLTVASLRETCATTTAITTDLLARLKTADDAAQTDLATSQANLIQEAQQIGADEEGKPLASFLNDIPLDEPAALDPLSQAIGAAKQTFTDQSARAEHATTQIEPAGKLDHAIAQGRSRLQDLDEIYALLADGKFPKHLTERRTRALLIVASDLFARLSAGRYGFTDNFRIITRATRTVRSAKTLSGGETFLASLALALALVELHGRNGARLGSLFLDEGFAALDSTTLASALAVLRDESNGDKLVVVISHLHAVAEAVDDVLWVQRAATGSQTRWLTGPERDALVYDNAQSGLLGLSDSQPAGNMASTRTSGQS